MSVKGRFWRLLKLQLGHTLDWSALQPHLCQAFWHAFMFPLWSSLVPFYGSGISSILILSLLLCYLSQLSKQFYSMVHFYEKQTIQKACSVQYFYFLIFHLVYGALLLIFIFIFKGVPLWIVYVLPARGNWNNSVFHMAHDVWHFPWNKFSYLFATCVPKFLDVFIIVWSLNFL